MCSPVCAYASHIDSTPGVLAGVTTTICMYICIVYTPVSIDPMYTCILEVCVKTPREREKERVREKNEEKKLHTP